MTLFKLGDNHYVVLEHVGAVQLDQCVIQYRLAGSLHSKDYPNRDVAAETFKRLLTALDSLSKEGAALKVFEGYAASQRHRGKYKVPVMDAVFEEWAASADRGLVSWRWKSSRQVYFEDNSQKVTIIRTASGSETTHTFHDALSPLAKLRAAARQLFDSLKTEEIDDDLR